MTELFQNKNVSSFWGRIHKSVRFWTALLCRHVILKGVGGVKYIEFLNKNYRKAGRGALHPLWRDSGIPVRQGIIFGLAIIRRETWIEPWQYNSSRGKPRINTVQVFLPAVRLHWTYWKRKTRCNMISSACKWEHCGAACQFRGRTHVFDSTLAQAKKETSSSQNSVGGWSTV